MQASIQLVLVHWRSGVGRKVAVGAAVVVDVEKTERGVAFVGTIANFMLQAAKKESAKTAISQMEILGFIIIY